MNILERVLRSVYPQVCEICGDRPASPDESYICSTCRLHRRAIKHINRPFCELCGFPYLGDISNEFICSNCSDLDLKFVSARAAVRYQGLVEQVIQRYKYGRQEWFEKFLVELLVDASRSQLAAVDIILPIPLYPKRHRKRGFNQAERLAKGLGKATGIPVATKFLRRIKDTGAQALLDRDERRANVNGAFQCVANGELAEKSVLLVDDVLTTGLTANACAKELLKKGVLAVYVWTVARGGTNQ